ncbi:MAG: adenosylcobinamide-GDP ribazoletransferase [Pseudomonadota bacterium]
MDWKKPLVDVLSVAAFFSRLPFWSLRARIDAHAPAEPLGKLAWAFPLAGCLIALPAALALLVLVQTPLSPLVLAGLIIAGLTFSTGALHEDGLADLCDGLGGGASRQRKLEIMRDSTIGTYGAAGLVFSLLLRVGSLASLIALLSPIQTALSFVAVAALSRTAMLWQWRTSQPARADGLARSQSTPTSKSFVTAASIAAFFAIALLLPIFGPLATAVSLLVSGLLIWGMCRMCERQIGGYTGDTLGAGQQIVETCLLICLSASAGALTL